MRVERIVAENIGDASHRRAAQDDVAQREKHREIEHGCKSRVDSVVASFSANEERSDAWVAMKNFANRRQARINPVQTRIPICPKLAADIRECIDAVAIQTRALRPPNGILE